MISDPQVSLPQSSSKQYSLNGSFDRVLPVCRLDAARRPLLFQRIQNLIALTSIVYVLYGDCVVPVSSR